MAPPPCRPISHRLMIPDALTPATRSVLQRIHRAGRPPLYTLAVEEARLAYEIGAEIMDLPRAPLARIEDLQVPARDGTSLRARLYANSHERLPMLLYLHGGGFTIGNLETHDSLCRQLAL
ncbi:alpha/beta hydrolase fold domain-containing protein, partial [Bosea sp. (in: a-proteobacteria)]|uniref:alpha/beta hydrolase fold domain-containing protein n=1 Tax=Bosea sp. (in: a-proteobacteria) TaxID=1871050 RepID=UPI002FC5C926